jgi:hypothetical protein
MFKSSNVPGFLGSWVPGFLPVASMEHGEDVSKVRLCFTQNNADEKQIFMDLITQ